MKKKVLFICGGGFLPHRNGNGNAVLTFGIVNVLLKLGFEVVITPVSTRCSSEKLAADKKILEDELGINVIQFGELMKPKSNSLKKPKTWMRLLFKDRDLDYFYSRSDANRLLEYIGESDFTHIYGYDWDTVSLFSFLDQKYKKIISLVDLMDVFFESKKKALFSKISLQTPLKVLGWALGRNKVAVGYAHLKSCDVIIEHAFQHANQLKEKGFSNVFYIPHPILKKELKQEREIGQEKVIISMIGSLKGVSSQLGFYYFVNELYPRVVERMAEFKHNFEFRIIGYGQLPPDLLKNLKRMKYVNFLGFVENVEEQYHEADVVFVAIPVSHGFRTRIAEAFSYKKCVIAHSANAEGMPEVENGINALVSEKADELVSMIIKAVNSKEVRKKISQNAFDTFSSKLSVEIACTTYQDLVDNR